MGWRVRGSGFRKICRCAAVASRRCYSHTFASAQFDRSAKREFASSDRSSFQRANLPNCGGTADGGNASTPRSSPQRDRARFIVADSGCMYSIYFRPPRLLPLRTQRRHWNRAMDADLRGWKAVKSAVPESEVATRTVRRAIPPRRLALRATLHAESRQDRRPIGFPMASLAREAARIRAACMISETNRILTSSNGALMEVVRVESIFPGFHHCRP